MPIFAAQGPMAISSGAAVVFKGNNTSGSDTVLLNAGTLNTLGTFTVPSNTNALLVGLSYQRTSIPTANITLTFNSVPMTNLGTVDETALSLSISIFGLLNPSLSSSDLVLSWTGGTDTRVNFNASAFGNVSSFGAVTGTFDESNTTINALVPSAVNHMVYGQVTTFAENILSATPTQIDLFNVSGNLKSGWMYGTTSGASVTISGTVNSNASLIIAGVDLIP